MDVHVHVLWAIQLDDPVDQREIETPGGNVRAYEEGDGGLREPLEDVQPGGLFLFPVQVHEGEAGVKTAEGFEDESDLWRAERAMRAK